MKRKVNIGYLINGGRRLFHKFNLPTVQVGMRLFAAAAAIGLMQWALALLILFAPVLVPVSNVLGIKFSWKKDGAEGDNLKLINMLEQRLSIEGDVTVPQDKIATEVRGALDKLGLTEAQATKLIAVIDEGDNGVRQLIKKLGTDVTELRALVAAKPKEQEDMSVRAQIEKWKETNKAAIAGLRASGAGSLPSLEIRVASPMTPANTLTSGATITANDVISSFVILPGVNQPLRAKPTFWDYIRKGAASSRVIGWVNMKNPLGAAGFIGPGVAKPGVSLELELLTSTAKKIAVSAKVAMETLDDVDQFSSLITGELAYKLLFKLNEQSMEGVESGTNIPGIQSFSVGYTLSGVSTPNPNYFDCIRAVVAQMNSGLLYGQVVVFVNPIDKANMDLTKAYGDGQRFMPGDIGAVIVEDNNIDVGYFQAAMLEYFNVLIYKGYTVTWGWENDDFTKNLATVIAEMRLHVYFNELYTGAFVYDQFANVQAGIEAEAV